MANSSPSQAKDQLCYYYQHRFLPVPFGLEAAESVSCSSLSLWFYCFVASGNCLRGVGRRDGKRMDNTHSVGHGVRLTVIQQTNSGNTFAVMLTAFSRT